MKKKHAKFFITNQLGIKFLNDLSYRDLRFFFLILEISKSDFGKIDVPNVPRIFSMLGTIHHPKSDFDNRKSDFEKIDVPNVPRIFSMVGTIHHPDFRI